MEPLPPFERLAGLDRPAVWGWLQTLRERCWTNQQGRQLLWHDFEAALGPVLESALAGQAPPQALPRPPQWLARAARNTIELTATTWRQTGGFELIRLLERLGIPVDVDDQYVLAIVGSLGSRHDPSRRLAALRDDAELRERFWRIFEVEGGGEISLANIDKFSAETATWRRSVLTLTEEGVLDRERLLTSCLEALRRDFSAYRAGWFSQLFRELRPTDDELVERQALLRHLLRSNVSATTTAAVEHLRRASRTRELEYEPNALRPGLGARTKAAAIGTVALFRDAGKQHPESLNELAPMLTDALEHPAVEVQAATIDLLATWNRKDIAVSAAATLAPTMRQRLDLSPTVAPQPQPGPQPDARLSPPRVRADLAERFAALLEDDRDPELLEHALADLARRPDAEALRPLTKRAARILTGEPPDRVPHERLRAQLARLVLLSTGEPAPQPAHVDPPCRSVVLLRRLQEIGTIVQGKRAPYRLLAEPTDTAGWLDPLEFADRFNAAEPEPADLIAAVLRLGPDDREAAATRIEGRTEAAHAARHALGFATPKRVRIHQHELWSAASRARAPEAEDPLLLRAGLEAAGRGRPVQAVFSASSTLHTGTDRGRPYSFTIWSYRLDVDHGVPSPSNWLSDGATETRRSGRRGLLEGWLDWLCYSTPASLEAVLTEEIWPVFDFGVNHDSPRLLRGILHHPSPLGPLGAIAATRGLVTDYAEDRVIAADAVIAHATRGTLTAESFAHATATLLPTEPITRWASALRVIASAAPTGFVLNSLETLLPQCEPGHRGLAHLTGLYRDLLLTESRHPTPPVRTWLGTIQGSSKVAADARAILRA